MSNAYSVKLPLDDILVSDLSYNRTIAELIRQNIKMILLTEPGERIMEPNFGVGFKKFLFEQMNQETSGRIEGRINEQFREYLPGVIINNINLTPMPDQNKYNIKIRFSYLPIGLENETVEITL
jgi:phage baseplate assembly protein W